MTDDAQFRADVRARARRAGSTSTSSTGTVRARQNAEAAADGLSLNRIEDGAWDPSNPNDYYFVTTAGSAEAGRARRRDGGGLWRLRFDDIENPRTAAR